MDDICADVGVSTRTFFNYFKCKDEAFIGLDTRSLDSIRDAVTERPVDESPLDALAAVVDGLMHAVTANGLWRDQALLLREYPELSAQVHISSTGAIDALAAGLSARISRQPEDPYIQAVCASVMSAYNVAFQLWLDAPDGSEASATLDMIIAYLRNGFAPPDD